MSCYGADLAWRDRRSAKETVAEQLLVIHSADSLRRTCKTFAGDGTRLPVNLNKANLQRSKSRELLRTAQPLRRQRSTHVGFYLCDIGGTDRTIGIHVFTEIPATNRHAHLRFGQSDVRRTDGAVAIHISN